MLMAERTNIAITLDRMIQSKLNEISMTDIESKDLPSSFRSLFTAIHKIKWWVLAAFATFSVIVLVLIASTSSTTQSVTKLLVEQLTNDILVQFGLIALLLLIFRMVESIKEGLKNRVVPFKKLTSQQQQYLMNVFRSGSSIVEVDIDTSNMQWFRELLAKNYMKFEMPPMISSADDSLTYYVSQTGWKKIEKYMKQHKISVG